MANIKGVLAEFTQANAPNTFSDWQQNENVPECQVIRLRLRIVNKRF